MMPTFFLSTVLKGLLLLEPTVEPVNTGTSWPTMKKASWLSSVVMLGVESTFELESFLTACTSAIQSPFTTPTAVPLKPERSWASVERSPLVSGLMVVAPFSLITVEPFCGFA